MPRIDYDFRLDASGNEWVRVRIITVNGLVIAFMVQYETGELDSIFPVVRYDTVHGFVHRDLIDRGGIQIRKDPLGPFASLNDALTVCLGDVRRNWPLYRRHI